jgi:hypothetical protein
MTTTINPAWIAYNDFQNEGGEGYNPHPKYVARAAAVVAPAAATRRAIVLAAADMAN